MGRKQTVLGDLIKQRGLTKKEVFTKLDICKQVFNDICEAPFQLGVSKFIKMAGILGMDGDELYDILDVKGDKKNFLK